MFYLLRILLMLDVYFILLDYVIGHIRVVIRLMIDLTSIIFTSLTSFSSETNRIPSHYDLIVKAFCCFCLKQFIIYPEILLNTDKLHLWNDVVITTPMIFKGLPFWIGVLV